MTAFNTVRIRVNTGNEAKFEAMNRTPGWLDAYRRSSGHGDLKLKEQRSSLNLASLRLGFHFGDGQKRTFKAARTT
jgi:hypothetical protein